MNQELGEFFIKFTTQGLTEVKDAIDSLSKRMDEVGVASEKATTKSDNFFGKLTAWAASLGVLTLALRGLKSAWDGVAEVSQKTVNLHWAALYTGTSAETLERWQKVARRNALNESSVISSFDSLYGFLYNYSNGQIPGEEFNKKIGLALQGTLGATEIQDSIMNSIITGNANAVLATLNKYISSGKLGSQASRAILSAFGIENETMMALLSQSNLAAQLAQVPVPGSNLQNAENSAKYELARAEMKEAIEDLWYKIQPDVTRLITWFTNTVLPDITRLIDEKWPAVESSVKGLLNWIIDTIENWGKKKDKLITSGAVGVGAATIASLAGLGMLPAAVIGGAAAWGASALWDWATKNDNIIAGTNIDKVSKELEQNKAAWDKLTSTEQLEYLLSGSTYFPDKDSPFLGQIPFNIVNEGGNAYATINIDGKEYIKAASGAVSRVDATMTVPLTPVLTY